jgi:hypothetical protein
MYKSYLLDHAFTVLMTIDYTTKWVEARALHTNINAMVARFIYDYIFTRFKCPLFIDQGMHFINDAIKHVTSHLLLKHSNFTTYGHHNLLTR